MTEFVQWLTGTHTCDCGAKYKVTVTATAPDSVTCERCGTLMDHPDNNSRLAFERVAADELTVKKTTSDAG